MQEQPDAADHVHVPSANAATLASWMRRVQYSHGELCSILCGDNPERAGENLKRYDTPEWMAANPGMNRMLEDFGKITARFHGLAGRTRARQMITATRALRWACTNRCPLPEVTLAALDIAGVVPDWRSLVPGQPLTRTESARDVESRPNRTAGYLPLTDVRARRWLTKKWLKWPSEIAPLILGLDPQTGDAGDLLASSSRDANFAFKLFVDEHSEPMCDRVPVSDVSGRGLVMWMVGHHLDVPLVIENAARALGFPTTSAEVEAAWSAVAGVLATMEIERRARGEGRGGSPPTEGNGEVVDLPEIRTAFQNIQRDLQSARYRAGTPALRVAVAKALLISLKTIGRFDVATVRHVFEQGGGRTWKDKIEKHWHFCDEADPKITISTKGWDSLKRVVKKYAADE